MKVKFINSTLKFENSIRNRYNIISGYNFPSASQTETGEIVSASIVETSATDRAVIVAPVKRGDVVVCSNLMGFSSSKNIFLIDTSWIVQGLYPIVSTDRFVASCDGVVIVGTLNEPHTTNPHIDVFSSTENNIEIYYQIEKGKYINSSGIINSTSGTSKLNSAINLNQGDLLSVAATPLNGNITTIGTTTDEIVDDSTHFTPQTNPAGTTQTNSQYTATEDCKAMASSANFYLIAMVIRA